VEEEPFWIDRMGTTVSAPHQVTVHLADKTTRDLYYECLDEGEARQFPTPKLLHKIDIQARYDAARATVLEYTLPVPISKKTSSQYSVHLPLFIFLIGKLAGATFPYPKRSRHRKQIAMTSNCYAQRPMECLTDKG
jgi:hypothetical protein